MFGKDLSTYTDQKSLEIYVFCFFFTQSDNLFVLSPALAFQHVTSAPRDQGNTRRGSKPRASGNLSRRSNAVNLTALLGRMDGLGDNEETARIRLYRLFLWFDLTHQDPRLQPAPATSASRRTRAISINQSITGKTTATGSEAGFQSVHDHTRCDCVYCFPINRPLWRPLLSGSVG